MMWRAREIYKNAIEKAARFVAFHLIPRQVRMWVVIRAGAIASQGQYSNQVVPDMLYMDVLKRAFPEK